MTVRDHDADHDVAARSESERGIGKFASQRQTIRDNPAHAVGAGSASYSSCRCRQLREEIIRALGTPGYLPLRNLEVSVAGGAVSLRGNVPSYYMKQLAQAIVLAMPGVTALRNELDISSHASR